MARHSSADSSVSLRYDRALLLSEKKRNQVLDLWEVQKYGVDSFGDADYVCLYGLRPSDWFARGVRLLARTAVECTRDRLAELIGRDVADLARAAHVNGGCVVIDPFAGSGNTLYWILRSLPKSKAIGFESDDRIFSLSRRNLSIVGVQIELVQGDYVSGLKSLAISPDEFIVAFVAPPWGDALSEISGLDLRRTRPPVVEIVDLITSTYKQNMILSAIQVYELIDPSSLAELKAKFDWSTLRIYDINAPGKNHGLFLGAKGWTN